MKKILSVPAVAALVVLGACNLPQPQVDTVRNFTLASPFEGAPVANPTHVRPVQVAGHLHPRSMVVRISPHEVTYLDDIRWAESLDSAITELLRARLAAVGGGATVAVEVQSCEVVRYEGNRVELSATFSVQPAGTDRAAARTAVFKTSSRIWDGKDYGALVGEIQAAIGELGDAIAAAITKPQ